MGGFPLTAWALRHPWGDDADGVLARLRAPRPAPTAEPLGAAAIAASLLDELGPACEKACARWGSSRVAVILGSAAPTIAAPLDRLSEMLGQIRRHTSISGPTYHVAATEAGGLKALASAERLLRASLVDAALVGGIDDGQGALLLVERHGESFVELRASAETTGLTDALQLDETAAERALHRAWAAGGRAPVGYVHVHADGPHADAERRVIQALLGDVPCCATRGVLGATGAAAGAIDVVLTAASLARGDTPEPQPRELSHDRALVHAFSPRGHHVAVLLEARP